MKNLFLIAFLALAGTIDAVALSVSCAGTALDPGIDPGRHPIAIEAELAVGADFKATINGQKLESRGSGPCSILKIEVI